MNKLTWTDASVGFYLHSQLYLQSKVIVSFITFSLLQVAESLSKYCVLLHLQAASVDATNFSAICILSFFFYETTLCIVCKAVSLDCV